MNEKTVGMLIGKKNVYEYPELSNAVTCMNYVNKETEIPPVLMMHGLADDKAWRSGILDREEYGYCGKIIEKKFSQQNKVLGNIEKFAENQGLQTFFFKEKVS